jgi:hypothetical protein
MRSSVRCLRIEAAALVLVVLAALLTALAPAAEAAAIPGNLIVNQAHGLCLDAVAQRDGQIGDPVQLWRCTGAANQRWRLSGFYQLVNDAHGLCLDAAGAANTNGTKIQLASCSNPSTQKEWISQSNAEVANFTLPKLCLDAVASSDGTNGGKVQLYKCWDGANQQWANNVINQAHGLCLDAVLQADGSNGDRVQLWSCLAGAHNQAWALRAVTVGDQHYFAFVNLAHGLCLDAADQGGTGSNTIQLWSCYYGAPQRWILDRGHWVNAAHSLCLAAATPSDGTNGDRTLLQPCAFNPGGIPAGPNQLWQGGLL